MSLAPNTGCGRATKGNPKDDALPCGVRLYWGVEIRNRVATILLCPKCEAAQTAEEEYTKP